MNLNIGFSGSNSYKPSRNFSLEFTPRVSYTHYNNRSVGMSADFNHQLSERYLGEALDSLFGGAGAFSDGKYNITNDFGGTLYEHIGKQPAIDLMEYVDEINMKYGGEGTKLYSTAGTKLKKVCMQNKLKLLDASVRHLGTDINYVVLENMYAHLKDKVDFYFDTPVESVERG